MIFSVSSSLSALSAYGTKMSVHADNVANVETGGYKKRQAVFKEGSGNQVQVEVKPVETPGPVITEVSDGRITEKELSNVDLAEEIPQTSLTQSGFEVNLKTLQAWDQMAGAVIDIFD